MLNFNDARLAQADIHNASALLITSTTWAQVSTLDPQRWAAVVPIAGGSLDLQGGVVDISAGVGVGLAGGRISNGTLLSTSDTPLHHDRFVQSELVNVVLETPLVVSNGHVDIRDSEIYRTSIDARGGHVLLHEDNRLDRAALLGRVTTARANLDVFGDLEINGELHVGGNFSSTLTFFGDSGLTGQGRMKIDADYQPQGVFTTIHLQGSRFNVGEQAHLDIHDNTTIEGIGAEFVNRGRVTAWHDVNVDANVYTFVNHGHVQLRHATLNIQGNTFINHSGGKFTGVGSVNVQGRTFINEGIISPGLSTGQLAFDSNLFLSPSGVFQITLDIEPDHLAVDGDVQLGGVLEITFGEDFAPDIGAVFDVITAQGDVSGAFDTVVVDHPHPVSAVVGVEGNVVQLHVAGLLGDMNLDGVIGTADVAAFVQALTDPQAYMIHFGVDEATMIALGDINQDGAFDTADVAPFVQLLVSGGSPSVPEPGSLALLGLGAMMLLRRVRQVP